MIRLMEYADTQRPQGMAPGERFVAVLLAAFAALAAAYGIGVVTGWLPFNSGAWVVGEDVAMRGALAYLLSALVHAIAIFGLWRRWRWAHWLTVLLLAVGLLPAVPGISSAVIDLRIPGIALWGTLIILRTAALYAMFSAE
jgi:hypothetical protein